MFIFGELHVSNIFISHQQGKLSHKENQLYSIKFSPRYQVIASENFVLKLASLNLKLCGKPSGIIQNYFDFSHGEKHENMSPLITIN